MTNAAAKSRSFRAADNQRPTVTHDFWAFQGGKMHRISRRMVAVVVLIGAIAAGGAAFTASNTIPDTVAGYGTSHITGATAHTLNYQISSDGTTITEADLVFQGDLTGDVVTAGFNTDNLQNCVVGTYDGSTYTPVTCSGFTQATTSAGTFNVLVTHPQS
jgi:hypothetical protein